MDRQRILYSTKSFCGAIVILVIRLLLFLSILVSALHFNENPIVISIIIVVLTFTLLKVGNPNIIVYDNKFTYEAGALLGRFKVRLEFNYDNLKEVRCNGIYYQGVEYVVEQLPIDIGTPWNKIEVIFKNCESKIFDTKIDKRKLSVAVKIINEQIKNK